MTGTHNGTDKLESSCVGKLGAYVCSSAAAAVNAVRSVGRSVKDNTKHSCQKIKKPAAEKRRLTAGMMLAEAGNILFPAASAAALILTVNHFASREYGVEVIYDGESLGVISGDNVLSVAQQVVADRVRYYDTNGDYYVNASLSITPLTSSSAVIDENALARAMEGRISSVYDEKPEEEPAEEEVISIEGKVKAYAVRVNGELIGAVEDNSEIEKALEDYKASFDDGSYTDISFNKEVVYDLEEYVDPEDIVPQSDVIKILMSRVKSAEYYEVQDGDFLTKIAEEHGMTLQELESCYATYNGKAITLQGNVLKSGTMIQFASSEAYLEVELTKNVTYRSDLPFNTVTIEDPTLPVGQTVVESEGENGEKRTHALVTYRDGKVIRRRTIDTEIYNDSSPQIIRVGVPAINHNAAKFKLGMGSGEYCWPVDGGYISAHIGDRRGHKGIDIAAPYGTPIYAAAAGTVIETSTGWSGGYGNVIKIQNDDGRLTVYAHQSELAAKTGDHVEMGQLIGYVGSTGDSTGNHLHFEVRENGLYLNPEEFVIQAGQPSIRYESQPSKPNAGMEHKPIDFSTDPLLAETTAETSEESVSETEETTEETTVSEEVTEAETEVTYETEDLEAILAAIETETVTETETTPPVTEPPSETQPEETTTELSMVAQITVTETSAVTEEDD